jgi:hypothetical protein
MAGTTLCSSSGRLSPKGVDVTDVDTLRYVGSSLYGDGAVGVDLGDHLGAGGSRNEFRRVLDP